MQMISGKGAKAPSFLKTVNKKVSFASFAALRAK
jgi:hypothetical protein